MTQACFTSGLAVFGVGATSPDLIYWSFNFQSSTGADPSFDLTLDSSTGFAGLVSTSAGFVGLASTSAYLAGFVSTYAGLTGFASTSAGLAFGGASAGLASTGVAFGSGAGAEGLVVGGSASLDIGFLEFLITGFYSLTIGL